jgi:hypothetical protein
MMDDRVEANFPLVQFVHGGPSQVQDGAATADAECRPIPATSISVSEADGDQGYLGIDVGAAELVFSLPLSAFGPIARTMLTASAQPKGGFVT